ncbi:GGDEF domain-containing protein [Colwellia hornerae]|uniref:diguanylate cyclase n=1 Tax=Colwellia hornerae TaxID=89402 RepID=A0A5C6QRB0_9GAMM|nr:GGDEF domain-containing protein [Colwellia hornerae]TWX55721.1 GGDEF domain-containing protein [Colwellia hornerae]TWX61931.1 GGDEF domain-containing protein [Colwellia hornerae]TWX71263.1 GGDEF domain-containing protein [Colwellia hornerae]
MLQKIIGLKTLFFSLVTFALVYFFMVKSQVFWLKQIVIVEQLLVVFLAVVIVFASYFNRSRLAYLSLLWLLYYGSISFSPPWSTWLAQQGDWLTLFGCCALLLFSLMKDRGVISVHGLYRLVAISVVAVIVFVWLTMSEPIILFVKALPNLAEFSQVIRLELPLALSSVVIVWRAMIKADLVTSALAVSLLFWLCHQYQLIELPISLTLTLLSLYYVLVIAIDAYFLAYRDDLTGLPSRRALNQLALSLGRKYTLAMLDIDHFKKFNDTYGHDIGDQVLKLVAKKIGSVKGGGKAFRYGGEEFTIVFPGKSIDQALPELVAVCQAIEAYKIVIRHPQRKTKQERNAKNAGKNNEFKTVNVTISIGAAVRENKQSFAQALKCADQALYKAKNKGRNNVSY